MRWQTCLYKFSLYKSKKQAVLDRLLFLWFDWVKNTSFCLSGMGVGGGIFERMTTKGEKQAATPKAE